MGKVQVKMGYEWYRSLSKKNRKKFRRNTQFYKNCYTIGNARLQVLLNHPTTKIDFFIIAFSWVESPEGVDYWYKLFKELKV